MRIIFFCLHLIKSSGNNLTLPAQKEPLGLSDSFSSVKTFDRIPAAFLIFLKIFEVENNELKLIV